MLEPRAWARSRRIFVVSKSAIDTDYLVTVIRKPHAPHAPSGFLGRMGRRGRQRAATYTYLFQVRTIKGRWATLHDARSGSIIPEHVGTVHAPESTLVDVAEEMLKQIGNFDLDGRIVFFAGDRTAERLCTERRARSRRARQRRAASPAGMTSARWCGTPPGTRQPNRLTGFRACSMPLSKDPTCLLAQSHADGP
jgi:hypothetical protein